LGQALLQLEIQDRILASLFVCEQQPCELLQQLKPAWNELIALPPDAKAAALGFTLNEIFPWIDELSLGVKPDRFATSFLIQPDLFVRLRPGKENIVKKKLRDAGINFSLISHSCIGLNNSIKLDGIIDLDAEAVVQDYNSQRVGEFLDFAHRSTALRTQSAPSTTLKVFDCCAASGGKSILAFDILNNIELTATDVRESILINLRKRFGRAGITRYHSFVLDLAKPKPGSSSREIQPESFDLVICDAPCTGSGTWSRTPEQLYYFQKERIAYYAELQESILSNVIPYLKKNGLLLYITCSVFKNENEQRVQFLQRDNNLELKKMEILEGYDKKSDSMFAALLQKPIEGNS
jgi:16S rRNA (cytosine967-C5)-methyltransferase